ncbi:DUF1152 domain-containing protein [Cryptosporangium japonicum]|uniref:DUF1152 domain-containing protein n=1 Tax=Cryptosporangium japonicum TaxID=80872 RepID=A0ABN0UBB9_9ACTN
MRLYVAAGGGGDAIAAALLHDDPTTRPVILTYAWERLILDPVPGPRSVDDFDGLGQDVPGIAEILATTKARPPARSPLPRLTTTLDARLFLLDPAGGAVGMREQIRAAVACFQPDDVIVVDVGGDIIARGDEPGLRSPMADALVLAAAQNLDVPAQVWVAGPGLDGELTEAEALARVDELGGVLHCSLTVADTHAIGDALDWHPTEATRLLVAAGFGYRGIVEIRDKGSLVALSERSADVYEFRLDRVFASSSLSQDFVGSTSLETVNAATRARSAHSELDYERAKASTEPTGTIRSSNPSEILTAGNIRGADYLTPRRYAELTGIALNRSHPTTADLLIPTSTNETDRVD